MRNSDIDKEQENLVIIGVDKDRYHSEYEPDKPEENHYTIWINVKNEGPKLLQIMYYQIKDLINENKYVVKEKVKNISPGETAIIDVIVENEDEKISQYVIQLISERGNIFSVEYPFVPAGYEQLLFDIHDILGDIIPVYDSFSWSKVDEKNDRILGWNNNWGIKKKQGLDKWYALSVRIRYFGKGDLTIKKESFIYLQNLGKQETKELYLVSLEGDKIVPYNEITLHESTIPKETEFVFAAVESGGLPGNSQLFAIGEQWQVSLTFLGIRDEGTAYEMAYGQSFPLIAITVIEE
jgi:hypothetical protein